MQLEVELLVRADAAETLIPYWLPIKGYPQSSTPGSRTVVLHLRIMTPWQLVAILVYRSGLKLLEDTDVYI